MLNKLSQAFAEIRKEMSALRSDLTSLSKIRATVPKDGAAGKDGEAGRTPDVQAIVDAAVAKIPTPDVQAIVDAAVAKIPAALHGRDAVPPTVADVAAVVLSKIPKPKNGVTPDVDAIIKKVVAMVPKPKDGVTPDVAAIAEQTAAIMPPPKGGPAGKDGVSITDVQVTDNKLYVYLDGKKKLAGRIKAPAMDAPFQPSGTGGGGRSAPAAVKPLYFENSSVAPADFAPGPKTTVTGLSLSTAGTSMAFNVSAQVQFTTQPQLATPVALADLVALTAELNALPDSVTHVAAFGNGETIQAGVYTVASASTHEGLLTFDAQDDPDALFVMIISGAEAVSTLASTALSNGARACNIFWVVVGALTIGPGCNLHGTYIASGAVGVDTLTLNGRILTPTGALALTEGLITVPLGVNTSLTLGYLDSLILFTGSGAVSNTVITSGLVGSVASNLGTITGFPALDGLIYTSNSRVVDATFVIESNDAAIPSSSTRFTSVEGAQNHHFFEKVILSGLSLKAEQQDVDVKITVGLGTVIVGNRNILAVEL